jgi:hypothetical protein
MELPTCTEPFTDHRDAVLMLLALIRPKGIVSVPVFHGTERTIRLNISPSVTID